MTTANLSGGGRGKKSKHQETVNKEAEVENDEIKLKDLEDTVPGSEAFVDTLRSMGHLHKMVTARTLSDDYQLIIWEFILNWSELSNTFCLNFTLKIHIINLGEG